MRVVRVTWFVLAVVAALLTVRFAFEPIADLSSTCSKGGLPDEFGARAGATCQDTTVTAFGVAHVIRLGVLFTVPPIVAGFLMRWWVSGLTVAVLACFSLIGVLGVNGFWVGLLVVGAPVAALSVIVAAVHVGMVAFRDSRAREPSPNSLNDLFKPHDRRDTAADKP
jgi:hypothetical protein